MDEFDEILYEIHNKLANANEKGMNSDAIKDLMSLRDLLMDVQKVEDRLISLGRVAHG